MRTISFNHDGQYIASASEDLFIDIVSCIHLDLLKVKSCGGDGALKQVICCDVAAVLESETFRDYLLCRRPGCSAIFSC